MYLPTVIEQLAVDAGRAPKPVGQAHLADQITDFRAHLGPSQTACSPAPVEPKALTMPLDHGCRFDQHHGVEDLRPNSVEPHPQEPVCGEEPNPTFVLPPQDTHLMSKGNELEFQGGATANAEAED